jgi:diguanylate cyclase (GGDEF)-like protein
VPTRGRPQGSQDDRAPDRWRPGVSARLLGTIAVPLVVMSVVLTSTVLESREQVQLATEVSDRVEQLEKLVALRSAMFKERVAGEIFLPTRRPPFELLSSTQFGAQLADRPEELVEATDEALAALDADVVPFDARDLAQARAEQPTEASGTEPARMRRFSELDEDLTRSITKDLTFVRESATALGDVDLIRAGAIFQRSVELPGQAGVVIAEIADLWVSEPAARPERQSRVAMALATFEASSARYVSSLEGTSAAELGVPEIPPMPERLRDAVDLALAGGLTTADRPAGTPTEVGVGLLDGVDWMLEVNGLPTLTAHTADEKAEAFAARARSTERQAAALAFGALGVSIVAAVLFGRSIVGPVRRLTDHAERIGAGQLEVDDRALHGPPEMVRAAQAMNDVVDNLVLLERKSNALVHADFDDPELQRQLPGRLGASLQLSMETLSTSIAQREALQAQLQYDAMHDSLTGLGNRAALIAMLSRVQQVDGAIRAAIVYIDLDNFKDINDRFGHAAGDDVLRAVAGRMMSVVPARALVARLGGDEFVIALDEVDGIDEPIQVARRVWEAIAQPVQIDGRSVDVAASIGVAIAGHGSSETGVEALLRMADFAVYSVKQHPTERIALYDEELHRQLVQQREVEEALRHALRPDADELRLVFQPIVDAQDLGLRGVEALLRWTKPDGERVGPDVFIPIAERSDLILEVDRWVLAHALAQLRVWGDELDGVSMSVNVSGRSILDRTFIECVGDALLASGVAASRLRLEVTETAIVEDLELAASHLAQLRALGVSVVIDDFGTGYTSVAHLRALPVDEIKVDASFVQHLDDEDNRVLVEMIVQLAEQLALPTVAEGVETQEQAEQLRGIGCTSLQGYLFSQPLEPQHVVEWGRQPVRQR